MKKLKRIIKEKLVVREDDVSLSTRHDNEELQHNLDFFTKRLSHTTSGDSRKSSVDEMIHSTLNSSTCSDSSILKSNTFLEDLKFM